MGSVLGGFADNRARATAAHRSQLEAAVVQDVERDLVSLADLSEHVVGRHPRVLENQRGGRGSVQPHLVFFLAVADAREATFHQEGSEPVGTLPDHFRKDDEEVGEAAVRDPHLFAADCEAPVCLSGCARLRTERIRPGSGLAECISTDQFAVDQSRQVLRFLRCVSETDDRRNGQAGLRTERRGKRCGSPHRFTDDDRGDLVQPDAAEIVRDIRAKKPEFTGASHQILRELPVLLFETLECRLDFVGHELVGCLTDETMLIG